MPISSGFIWGRNDLFQLLHERSQTIRLKGRYGDGVEAPAEGRQQGLVGKAVGLVEDPEGGFSLYADLFQDFFHGGDVAFEAGVAYIDDVEEDVRFIEFLQRGLESGEEIRREVSDEAHRIGYDGFRIPGEAQP